MTPAGYRQGTACRLAFRLDARNGPAVRSKNISGQNFGTVTLTPLRATEAADRSVAVARARRQPREADPLCGVRGGAARGAPASSSGRPQAILSACVRSLPAANSLEPLERLHVCVY